MSMRARQAGLSYVEVLIATALLGVALVPALDALRGGVAASRGGAAVAAEWTRAQDRLEQVLALPWAQLDAAAGAPTTPGALSDAAGTPARRLVYVARYDGDNADADNDPYTGTDAGLLWVSVAIEGSAVRLSTLAQE